MLTLTLALLPILLTLLPTLSHATPSPQDTTIMTSSQPPTAAAATTILAAASITTITTDAIPSTITTTISSATTPPSPQYTNPLTLRTSLLNSTNLYRYQHNASFLSWNDSLATYASNYASKCIWSHSHGAPGENLARGYPDVTTSVDAWANERSFYTFSPPSNITGFSEATGHFTQLVWKATQTVGCAAFACNGVNGLAGYMFVCEYWPPGNIEGTGDQRNVFFEQNVQGQVRVGEDGFDMYSATVGASGVGTSTATGTLVPTGSPTGSSGVGGREGLLGFGVGVLGVGVGLLGGI